MSQTFIVDAHLDLAMKVTLSEKCLEVTYISNRKFDRGLIV